MTTVLEQHKDLQETVECDARCATCSTVIAREVVVVGAGVAIPHRVVTGSYVQFVDAESGEPFGPMWGFCSRCLEAGVATNPVNLPEVQAAYRKLTGE